MGVFMQNATYGIYKDGQIIFDEPDVNINNSRVLVVFLDDEPREQKLTDFFELYGPWEDTRDIETIISDIRNSRISKDNIIL
jgi:cell division septal protein FtsQ